MVLLTLILVSISGGCLSHFSNTQVLFFAHISWFTRFIISNLWLFGFLFHSCGLPDFWVFLCLIRLFGFPIGHHSFASLIFFRIVSVTFDSRVIAPRNQQTHDLTHTHIHTHTGSHVDGDGSITVWCTRLHYTPHHWWYRGLFLFSGSINSVKWTLFAVIFGGWIVTCLCAGLYWCFTGDLDPQYRCFVGFCSNPGVYRICWTPPGVFLNLWSLPGVYLNLLSLPGVLIFNPQINPRYHEQIR